jgi:hypothetical protein
MKIAVTFGAAVILLAVYSANALPVTGLAGREEWVTLRDFRVLSRGTIFFLPCVRRHTNGLPGRESGETTVLGGRSGTVD